MDRSSGWYSTVLKIALVAAIVLTTAEAHAQTNHDHHSAYADQADSGIASLSADEVSRLETGEGMGLARAAELNGYPGPKHVLEAADELELSEEQRRETQKIFDEMKAEAMSIGKEIVEKERALSKRFEHRHIDERLLATLVGEIAVLQGELRSAHLRAHLEMAELMSDDQIDEYDRLRGYGGK